MKSNQTFIKNFLASSIAGTAVMAAALTSISVNAADYKHVAVAPEHINAQKMPSAQSKGIFSHSTMLPIYNNLLTNITTKNTAGKTLNVEQIEQKITLDGAMDSPIVLLTPDAENWLISLTNPTGQMVYNELSDAANALAVGHIQVGPQSFKGKQLSIQKPVAGQWTIKLTRKGNAPLKSRTANSDKTVAAYLLFKGDNDFQAYSYLDNNFTVQNNTIHIVAQMSDTTLNKGERSVMVQKRAVTGAINSAVATIKSPSGKYSTIALNDEGIAGDKIAGDGLFGAKVPTDEIGVYTNQVQIQGVRPDGKGFSRTTTDIYPIAAASFDFTKKSAQIKQLDNTSALLSVPVKRFDQTESVFMAAQIWGTNADGQLQSAAWVGGIVSPKTNGQSDAVLDLAFDTRWLSREKLKAPFVLKALRLQTVDSNVPLAQRDELALDSTPALNKSIATSIKTAANQSRFRAITADMRMGKVPAKFSGKNPQKQTETTAAAGSKLLLVHGYCSGQAWKESDFYDSDEFQDYKNSISHDAFAKKVQSFGGAYSSYGIVAHSQGGAAALHLYSKYWSGLDNATGGRLIQSVGTPYQGTALAGNLAAIGDVFGAGCGTNTDLTYSGASNWLSTIPTWARNQVDYYTTSFDTAWWSYDYCHLATDLFLDDPEDGTTEKWSGQLSGGVNKGHKKGWCHTGGMRDPAQTKDGSRNSTMESNAAR